LGVLIENSIDSVQRFQDDRRYVNLITQLKGNEIEFSVVDGGPKLSDEVVKNLMAPFFTTKEQGSGTGLNLSIAFALAKSHKGNLFYDKSATTVRFCFTIPKLVSRQNRRAS
jgi:C4-dicarboxylate-specific signal transduction histidine kinase